jgi:hypothetical protein
MTDSENFVDSLVQTDLPETFERVRDSTATLGISTASFARAISRAFADATAGGKQFDDVLKQLALRLSNMALMQAFSPAAKASAGGLTKLLQEPRLTRTAPNLQPKTPAKKLLPIWPPANWRWSSASASWRMQSFSRSRGVGTLRFRGRCLLSLSLFTCGRS